MKLPELNSIVCGDALTVLKTMPDESVDCCVTKRIFGGNNAFAISFLWRNNTVSFCFLFFAHALILTSVLKYCCIA